MATITPADKYWRYQRPIWNATTSSWVGANMDDKVCVACGKVRPLGVAWYSWHTEDDSEEYMCPECYADDVEILNFDKERIKQCV